MREQSKKYYYDLQVSEIEKIKGLETKPSLLMHTCCAVCACYPIQYLTQYFDLTLFYNNDNIYPESEYDRRFSELERYVSLFNEEYGQTVKIVKTPYRGVEYVKNLVPLKDEPEGGKRCHLCYRLRIEEGYRYAEEHGFDYYTTVMTISRQKDSRVMNEIGADLQKSYPNTRYFHSDFKKNGGLEKAAEIIKKYNIYSQNYCGCIFSYEDMLNRVKNDYRS